ncbi:phosphatase PAP2 family protein [Prevotella sp.]|uniref:phosphatase PAP2 family protein n=1 Tax=Prevotella sp. TaxID=59823 RepID=UPI003AB9817C
MRILFLIVFLSASAGCFAQADTSRVVTDSLISDMTFSTPKKIAFLDKLPHGKLFNSTYIGVPLIIGGLIEKHQDSKFRKLRNDFMPRFHRTLDNYTQIAPAAVMVGMKAAGVESRSSWGRMLLSDAFSVALMAGTVLGLKNTTNVMRPDGSDNHSFPSGHTATAFMTATMLNKEYGYKSPWIGVGAYSVATATGLMRMANNKHWLSDVLVGAGIGIMATEFGYWLADLIYKDKGLNIKNRDVADDEFDVRRNSFLGLYMGFNLPLSKYDLDEDNVFQTSTGTTIGLEGAWFINRNIGIGGRASFSNLQYIVNKNDAPDKTFNYFTAMAGPYFSFPVTHRFSLGSKLVGGGVWYPKTSINGISVGNNHGFSCGTGLSLKYDVRKHLSGIIFLDYNIQAPASHGSREYMHIMTLGAKVALRL